jgi:hypothetical protein
VVLRGRPNVFINYYNYLIQYDLKLSWILMCGSVFFSTSSILNTKSGNTVT